MKLLIKLLLKKLPANLGEKLHVALWKIRALGIILICPVLKLVAPVWGGRFPMSSIPRGIVGVRTTNAKITEIPGVVGELWPDAKTLGEKCLEDYLDDCDNPKSIILAELPHAIVDGATGAVLNSDYALISELSTYCMRADVEPPWDHPIFFRPKRCKVRKLEGAVVLLSNPNSHVYFHWLLEMLPRLGILEKHGILPKDFTCLVPEISGFFLDSIESAGVDKINLVRMESGVRYQIENLITTSDIYPQGMVATFAPYLHKIFLPTDHTVNRKKMIYISRRLAGLRPVNNESRLINLIEEMGGEVVILEGMKIRDQAELFYSTDIIITAHGSALSNLVFCKPGTKVLELFSGAYVRSLYPLIGTAMKLDYWYLIGNNHKKNKEDDSLYAAIDIEYNIFRETLLKLLAHN